MKKLLRKFAVMLLLIAAFAGARAQDIHFSQFFEAPLLRNPSLAGIFTGDIRVQAVFRNQWTSITNAYNTGSFNAEYKLPIGKGSDYITPGVQILYDEAGDVSWVTTHFLAALNYHKSLSVDRNRYLSLGFMAGPVESHLDRSKMTTNSTYDGLGDGETFIKSSYSYVDASVGMSYNSQLNDNADNNMYVGLAYHHLNKPKGAFYQNLATPLDADWVASVGVKFSVTAQNFITLQADESIQGAAQETVAGFLYGIKVGEDPEHPAYTIHGGTFLRWNDALIPVVKVDYSPFSFTLSYDVNISKLKASTYGRGGFELGLSYIGFTNKKTTTLNVMNCPRF